ncbi:MAG: hypothetical protein LAP87_12170 [Acidobacteriia bacterium]|nr:hypothetical protein [Terriglobia bacterium]
MPAKAKGGKKRTLLAQHPTRLKISGKRTATAQITACDCRARNAFHEWRDGALPPSFNMEFNFSIPAKSRLVIEFVTASILVPAGEMARLRMFTGLGSSPSNLDLALTPQGIVGGQQILVATHCARAYADSLLAFNVNRDNAVTTGSALICVSGYLEPL